MAGEPKLQQGSDNEEWVRYLQQLLEQYGYDLGDDSTSGNFGADTEAAVRQFQEANVDGYGRQLVEDGVVAPRTWSCLTQSDEIEGEERPTEDDSTQKEATDEASGFGGDLSRDIGSEADRMGADDVGNVVGDGERVDDDDDAAGGQSYEYDEPVNLVQQETDNTCWAACCAMLLGTTEDDIIERVGDAGGDGADEPEMTTIASELGLQMPPPQCQGPDGWYQMMVDNGPLMVGIPRHYIVVAGIRSDGEFDNTQFHLYDPARGEEWKPFNDVNSEYEIDADAGANLLTR